MIDGLYRVTTGSFVAGFRMKDHRVSRCAPILRRRIDYWRTVAKLISR